MPMGGGRASSASDTLARLQQTQIATAIDNLGLLLNTLRGGSAEQAMRERDFSRLAEMRVGGRRTSQSEASEGWPEEAP